MVKIYYDRYKKRIDNGEITVQEAIDLAQTEVPTRWRADVVSMLEALI